jgi:hypothetical protein
VVKAVRSNQAKIRKQKGAGKAGALKKFKLGYRRKKGAKQDSFVVQKRYYQAKRGPWWELLGQGKMRAAEPLPEVIQFDARITRNRLGKYHLRMPVTVCATGTQREPQ